MVKKTVISAAIFVLTGGVMAHGASFNPDNSASPYKIDMPEITIPSAGMPKAGILSDLLLLSALGSDGECMSVTNIQLEKFISSFKNWSEETDSYVADIVAENPSLAVDLIKYSIDFRRLCGDMENNANIAESTRKLWKSMFYYMGKVQPRFAEAINNRFKELDKKSDSQLVDMVKKDKGFVLLMSSLCSEVQERLGFMAGDAFWDGLLGLAKKTGERLDKALSSVSD